MKTNKLIKYMVAALAVALSPLAQATQVPGVAEQPDSYFYTGKPYDADLGGYTFAYRTYDPEVNRWTSADPCGFPDGANNSIYSGNHASFALDPDGFTFLYFDGSSLSSWSGAGYQGIGQPIDWGDRTNDWGAVSGGAEIWNGTQHTGVAAKPINDGWWRVGQRDEPAGGGTGLPSEADGHINGQWAQGAMSAWANPNDRSQGYTQYKWALTFITGRGIADPGRSGIRIHPDGPEYNTGPGFSTWGTTHGCVGISGYSNAVSVDSYLNSHPGIELYVE